MFNTAAIGSHSVVHAIAEELLKQIRIGAVNLDTIKPCLYGSLSSLRVLFYGTLNLLFCHLSRRLKVR